MIPVYGEIGHVDILAIGIHPDDIELSCSGTVLSHIAKGYTVGICDLTKGELGTRGDAKTRLRESKEAAKILGIEWRINLEMRDGFSRVNEDHILRVAEIIRLSSPRIILANSIKDRHPDHGRGARIVGEAHFFSGLPKITTIQGKPHRAKALYHYVQDEYVEPDFCVDVSDFVEHKFHSIRAFETQFYQGDEDGNRQTPISSKSFMDFLDARMRHFGRSIGVSHAEGFVAHRKIGVSDLGDLL